MDPVTLLIHCDHWDGVVTLEYERPQRGDVIHQCAWRCPYCGKANSLELVGQFLRVTPGSQGGSGSAPRH